MVDKIAFWLDRLFNQYKFVRRFLIFWFTGLVSTIVMFCLLKPDVVTDPVSRVFIAVIGLATVVFGLYQWLRERDQ